MPCEFRKNSCARCIWRFLLHACSFLARVYMRNRLLAIWRERYSSCLLMIAGAGTCRADIPVVAPVSRA